MDTFTGKVKEYIKKNEMLSPGDTVIAGVSGGADSVCMLIALCSLREELDFQVCAVHLNHMIRGEEADRDEDFVKALCDRLSVPLKCFHRNIPELAKKEGLTCEEAGRNARYEAFRQTAEEMGDTAKIAVAHNRNDLVETVIFNIARGLSIKGLSGIRPVRDNIIRPILFAGREEIEAFLESSGQDFCTDSTNLSDDYARNRVRHNIIPELEKLNSGAVMHICSLAGDADEMAEYIASEAKAFISDKVTFKMAGAEISPAELEKQAPTLQREIILAVMEAICGRRKDITRKHINSVCDIAFGHNGRSVSLPYNLLARKSSDRLIISDDVGRVTGENRGRLEIREISAGEYVHFIKNKYTEIIDCDKIKGTLCLRTPEPGDTMVINSTGGRKKLSKLFTDLKVDRLEREEWPVVADDEDVIWLPGLRLSEAYKIEESSERGICLEYLRDREQ